MHPTVLIGLDGATFTVLDPLLAEGHMPFLQKLLADGVRAPLLSTPHPLTPPAWTTLMTGRTPGHHGIFDFLRADLHAAGAFLTLNNFRDVQCETIWTIVSRMGGRIIALNFPLMAPPPPVAGALVPGLLSWKHLRRNLYPPELYDELKALPGFNPKDISWSFENEKKGLQNVPEEELEPWVRHHIVREKQWFSILNHLMQTEPADLTAVMFDGVDKLQHGCWRFLDPRFLPVSPTPFERLMRGLCLDYFRQLDGFLEQIVQRAGPLARVFLASDHGFGPSTKVFRVNKWLQQQGWLQWPDHHRPSNGEAPGKHKLGERHAILLDWERTLAYAQSPATNGIHIRVKQSVDDSGVSPDDYESFRARLIDRLLAVRDPQTGGRLVKNVLKRDEVFPGPHMEKGPDLTLVLNDHGFISTVDADPVVLVRPSVTGTHYPEGIFAAAGPDIVKGQTLERQSIVDVAATLLYSLGLPIPEDFEGKPMLAAFAGAYRAGHPLRVGPATEPPNTYGSRTTPMEQDAGEEEKILDRLRALGYVE